MDIGEAFITAEIAGMSQQTFRTTKKKLSKWGFAEFKPTPKGTIARLTTDKFFKL
nr:MAG TPA: helix-turn-helix domain protein [Caudoviricetes sp.]